MKIADHFISENMKTGCFMFVGHCYEFNNDNNWNVIEELAESVSFKDDIWYTANIEIYYYIKAYESMITSLDNKMIYSPTITGVWFTQNRKRYCIHGGETLFL